jgi:3-oxoadipate enol-lactonase
MPHAEGKERLYYETRGEGPPLLLVRGLSRSLRFWPRPFLEALEARFTLVLYDHRGIGRSTCPSARFTTRDLADDACRVLDAAGIGRAHVFGLSLGGMVAQEIALRCADRTDRLVLGASYASPLKHGPRYRSFAPLLLGNALKGARGQAMHAKVLMTPGFAEKNPHIAVAWAEVLESEPLIRKTVLGQMLAALRHDCYRRLVDLKAETLVVVGDADRLIPMKSSLLLHKTIPGAKLEVLPGAGHDFVAQMPERSAALLGGFFGARPAEQRSA